jgi:6-methylsalicylate decarboxylase
MAGFDVVDVHTHLPIAYGDRFDPAGLPLGLTPWTLEGALAVLDDHGLAAAVLSNPFLVTGPQALERTQAVNDRYAELRVLSRGRLGGLAALPLHDPNAAAAEAARALDELSLDGVCLPTHVDGRRLGDPEFTPVWRALQARGAVAFIHPVHPPAFGETGMGYPVATLEFMFESTRMITNLIYSGVKQRFPGVKVISTHGGGSTPYLAARIAGLAEFLGVGGGVLRAPEAVLADLRTFYFDITACANPHALPALLALVPPDRLMMGFDWPMMPRTLIRPALEFIAETPLLDEAARQQIRAGTARTLFPRLAKRA